MTKVVLPVAFALLSVACSGNSSPSSSDEDSSTSVAPGNVPRPGQSPGGGNPVNVALPAGGPIDNVIPPNTEAYRLLSGGQCDQLLGEINGRWRGPDRLNDPRDFYLYRGAANACKGRWEEARKDREALNKLGRASYGARCPRHPDDRVSCEACKAAALRWLDSVLAARAKDPSFSPVFVKASGSSRICPSATVTTRRTPTRGPTTTDAHTEPPTTDAPTEESNP